MTRTPAPVVPASMLGVLAAALLMSSCMPRPAPAVSSGGTGVEAAVPATTDPPGTIVNAYKSAILADHPVAYWPLDDGGVDSAAASAGAGYPLQIQGVTRTQGAFADSASQALEASGAAGSVMQVRRFDGFPAQSVSVEFWVRTTNSGGGLLSYAAPRAGKQLRILAPENLRLDQGGQQFITGVAVNDGTWHHVVWTWQASQGETFLYVDGRQAAAGLLSTTPNPNNGSLAIAQAQEDVGVFTPERALSGALDDVAVYGQVLSPERVRAHYAAAGREVAALQLPTWSPGADPVVAAVGDAACDPTNPALNHADRPRVLCQASGPAALTRDAQVNGVLFLGDLQYEDGSLAKFTQAFDPVWGWAKGIAYPVPGNHEYETKGASGYFSYFGEAAGDPSKGYYSFDLGAWHLVALNGNCKEVGGCQAGSPQEQWLVADLAAHPSRCTLAYWHQPRYSSGVHGSDTAYVDLWKALYAAGADLVLAGHDHQYERFAPQDALGNLDSTAGAREFVVGTGGRSTESIPQIRPNSEVRNTGTFGVLLLTLRENGYEWQFRDEAGSSFADAGSDQCH